MNVMATSETSNPAIYGDVVEAIASWDPDDGPLNWSDERFDRIARRIFAYQFEHNATYRSFCERRGVGPEEVETHREIPAVATDVFKHVDLGVARDPVRTFRTSGTTTGRRGRHPFETLEVYRASLHPPFVRFCNPERAEMRMLVCAPRPADEPDSSLSFMLGELIERWDDGAGKFFVGRPEPGDGADRSFEFDAFASALDRSEREKVPTMVLGTAFAFAEFFDRYNGNWNLPEGSRFLETGGFKGRTRELTKDDLYGAFEDRFGLDRCRGISEYSMTELSSQAYTPGIAELELAEDCLPSERPFRGPPWARIEVVDPATLEILEEPGERGLIRWYDLANVGSVCAVQTSDLGRVAERGGVVHLGRAEGAEMRGCSLTAEEIAGDSNP
jgi:hypothetical protein